MSKASEWAKLRRQRPRFSMEQGTNNRDSVSMNHGWLIAEINDNGHLEVTQMCNDLDPKIALAFAKWILDVYGDE